MRSGLKAERALLAQGAAEAIVKELSVDGVPELHGLSYVAASKDLDGAYARQSVILAALAGIVKDQAQEIEELRGLLPVKEAAPKK